MLILGVTNPQGKKYHVAAAASQRLRQDQLLHAGAAEAAFNGWKVTTIGDDIAWIKPRRRPMYAINPEAGYFGVAPAPTCTNPNCMRA